MPNPMRRAPTILDVAERAGVAPQTVSNVLYRLKQPRPETLRRVSEAIEALGYQPNSAARALRSQRIEAVSLLLEDPSGLGIHDPLHAEFLQGACLAARRRGFTIGVDFLRPAEIAAQARRLVRERKAGALILSLGALGAERRRLLPELAAGGTPVVLLQQPARLPGVSTVRAENRQGARLAVRHLAGLGRRRLVLLSAEPAWPAPRERRLGARAACRAAGMAMLEWCCATYTVEAARAATAALLRRRPRIDALLAVNDVVALGAIQALVQAGRRVPEDVAVVGFNDFGFSAWVRPSISTVRIPGQAMGERAAEIAMEPAAGPAAARHVRFPVELVVRESAAPAAARAPG